MLFIMAVQADAQLAAKGRGKPGETLEKAAESLMACFRVCASDKYVSMAIRQFSKMICDSVISPIHVHNDFETWNKTIYSQKFHLCINR